MRVVGCPYVFVRLETNDRRRKPEAPFEEGRDKRDVLMSIHANEETLPKPKWLKIEQLMQILPLKKSRIYYLTHIGGIPHHKIGQTLLFREDEILEWMQSNKVA